MEAAEMFGHAKHRTKSGIASASNASKTHKFWVPTLLGSWLEGENIQISDCDDAIKIEFMLVVARFGANMSFSDLKKVTLNDIKDFYPNIKEPLLDKAIEFARLMNTLMNRQLG